MEDVHREVKKRRQKSSDGLCSFHPRYSTGEHQQPNQKAISPETLFNICVKYVSSHLHLVESFHEFPDLIGETIFSCAAQSQQFTETSDTSLHALALFCNAYAGSVLERINLHSCHLGVADYAEHLCLFKHLTHLDLTSCGLGDNHELMVHIAASNSLECLYLSDNGLTSSGIQKMTSPLRVLGRGPMTLQILSLADNPGITVQAIRYLKCFPALSALDVTGTSISVHETGQVQLQLGLYHIPGVPLKPESIVEDAGWAVPVVRDWMQKTIPRDVPMARTEAHKFYKKAKDPALLALSLRTSLSTNIHDQDRILLCFTNTFTSTDTTLEIKKTSIKNNALTNIKTDMLRINNVNRCNKKSNASERPQRSMNEKQAVKRKEDELDAEDELMMRSYTMAMDSGKLDLWQAMSSKLW